MKPIVTEKAIMLVERTNTLTFEVDRRLSRDKIKKIFEEMYDVKVEKVNVSIRNNKKYAHIRLKKEFPAIDLASKIGMI